MRRSMIKLYLFSGFLGSGKTTLVTTLAKKW
ncbi:GTP-binding protein [endosymbiont 'TC1' of Trimyema compressum]